MLINFALVASAYTPATCRYSEWVYFLHINEQFSISKASLQRKSLTTPQNLLPEVPYRSQQKQCYICFFVNSKCKLWEKERKIISVYDFFRELLKYACRNISKHINLKEMLNHLSVKLRSSIHVFIIVHTQTFLTVLLQKIWEIQMTRNSSFP